MVKQNKKHESVMMIERGGGKEKKKIPILKYIPYALGKNSSGLVGAHSR